MNTTNIIWTEATWNPMSGCKEVSEGCKFCYAKTLAENRRGTKAFPNGFDLTIRRHKLSEPLKLKTPTLIFVNSMSDLFWEEVPMSYRDEIVDVIEDTPQHQYQVLTKRPDTMLEYSRRRTLPPNFWAGATIENDRAKHRLEILRQVKAEIRFVSAEPLIGRIVEPDLSGIQWLITGGESGTHMWTDSIAERRGLVRYDRALKKWLVRDDRAGWVRELRDSALRYGVKYFHKQWGGHFPEAAGRVIDGRTWDEVPRLPGSRTEIENEYLRIINERSGVKELLLFDDVAG